VAGWPVEDVLQAHQNRVPPDLRTVVRLQAAAEADASLEVIEGLLGDDPVLAYRFLRYANSAVFNLRDGVEALRQGIMVLGMSRFRQWLGEQLAGATEDPQLLPVRRAMVVRARLVEHLLDAGDEVRLRHEVSLCARLAQIDLLVGEPLLQAVQHIPLSERVLEGIISHRGPYAPYLELAAALEYPQMPTVPGLCDTHGVDIADVNRELLRVLSQSHLDPAWGR
jgi:c-di-GMP-related signal transduction protein